MKILSIETSCDETAVALLSINKNKVKILGNALNSQVDIHKKYGGVFPNLAKREHQKNLIPLLIKALPSKPKIKPNVFDKNILKKISKILEREPELLSLFDEVYKLEKPKIDRIAVTVGPGLEPALWVGINFAKALSILWNIEIVAVNHMQGHFLAPIAENKKIEFPALGLLISGGHTEIVLASSPIKYKLIGTTVDDAVGEAYDKVARILGLPYPGGPEIAKLAEKARKENVSCNFTLPRPMIKTKDVVFSFSGLKTAVLYLVQKLKILDEKTRICIAKEFEEAVKDVLVSKTEIAIKKYKVQSLVIGGGVSANTYIKDEIKRLTKRHNLKFITPDKKLSTDNAIMIGIAGYFSKPKSIKTLKALGNLPIKQI